MSADIIPLPRAFKPHEVSTDALIFGEAKSENITPYAEMLEEFAPISPRETFGLRPATGEALFNIERPRDRAEQEAFKAQARGGEDRVKRAARLAAQEHAALGDRKHICPTLDVSLSERIAWLGQMAASLAQEARGLGHLRASVTLGDISGFADTVSAELLIPHTPESA